MNLFAFAEETATVAEKTTETVTNTFNNSWDAVVRQL